MENLTVLSIIKTHFKNRSRLARLMGIAPQTVQGWTQRNRLPMRRAYQIAELTRGSVTFGEMLHLVDLPTVKNKN